MNLYEKSCLDNIVKILLEEGILWGDELEWYIRKSVEGEIKVDNDEKYMELENYILESLEKKRRNLIKVKDLKTNKIYIFDSATKMQREIGIPDYRIHQIKKNKLSNKTIYKKRYEISVGDISIREFSGI